jgi:hypothetical protein
MSYYSGHGILATTDISLTNMCELAFIEYNPTFDSIMPFPCFFDVTRKTSVTFNNCHLNDTKDWFTSFFLEMSKKCWPRFRVRNSTCLFYNYELYV